MFPTPQIFITNTDTENTAPTLPATTSSTTTPTSSPPGDENQDDDQTTPTQRDFPAGIPLQGGVKRKAQSEPESAVSISGSDTETEEAQTNPKLKLTLSSRKRTRETLEEETAPERELRLQPEARLEQTRDEELIEPESNPDSEKQELDQADLQPPQKKRRKMPSNKHTHDSTHSRPSSPSGSGSKRHSHGSGGHHGHSSGSGKGNGTGGRQLKSDNWKDVTDSEERRRIQNRIAQRKFREKERTRREHTERDTQNRLLAGSSYHIPSGSDIPPDPATLSGLPWGGVSMNHVVDSARRSRNSATSASGSGAGGASGAGSGASGSGSGTGAWIGSIENYDTYDSNSYDPTAATTAGSGYTSYDADITSNAAGIGYSSYSTPTTGTSLSASTLSSRSSQNQYYDTYLTPTTTGASPSALSPSGIAVGGYDTTGLEMGLGVGAGEDYYVIEGGTSPGLGGVGYGEKYEGQGYEGGYGYDATDYEYGGTRGDGMGAQGQGGRGGYHRHHHSRG